MGKIIYYIFLYAKILQNKLYFMDYFCGSSFADFFYSVDMKNNSPKHLALNNATVIEITVHLEV